MIREVQRDLIPDVCHHWSGNRNGDTGKILFRRPEKQLAHKLGCNMLGPRSLRKSTPPVGISVLLTRFRFDLLRGFDEDGDRLRTRAASCSRRPLTLDLRTIKPTAVFIHPG